MTTKKPYIARDYIKMMQPPQDNYACKCPECGREGKMNGDDIDSFPLKNNVREIEFPCGHKVPIQY